MNGFIPGFLQDGYGSLQIDELEHSEELVELHDIFVAPGQV